MTRRALLDARVIDQDVQATERRDGFVHHADHLGFTGNIALYKDAAAGRACLQHFFENGFRFRPLLGTAVIDGYQRAFFGEPNGGRPADAGGSTGNEDRFACKTFHDTSRE